MKDEELEDLMTKFRESKNSNNKLLYYKKAVKRLDGLRSEYNNLCKIVTDNKEAPANVNVDASCSIEKIVNKLTAISDNIDANHASGSASDGDIAAIINDYCNYATILTAMQNKYESFTNEIFKVTSDRKQISISKIDISNML